MAIGNTTVNPSRRPAWMTAAIAMIAAFVLFIGIGTSFDYAVLATAHLILSAIVFHSSGGFRSPVGLCTFSLVFQGPLLAHFFKALMLSPLDEGLRAPLATIAVHTGGMACLLVGSLTTASLRRRLPLIRPTVDPRELNYLWLFGSALTAADYLFPVLGAPTALSNLMTYANFAPALAVSAATAHSVVVSEGRTAASPRVLITIGVLFLEGLSYGAKEAMALAGLSWLVTAIAFGFRLKGPHIATICFSVAAAWFGIFPLAYLRGSFAQGDFIERLRTIGELATEVSSLDEMALLGVDDPEVLAELQRSNDSYRYLKTDSIFLSRVSLYPASDRLVWYRLSGGPLGWSVVEKSLTLLPAAVTGVGAEINPSNLLGRQSNVLQPDDVVTGVSFGPFAENFAFLPIDEAVLVTTAVWALFAWSMTLIFGDFRGSVWACAIGLTVRHGVSESSSLMQMFTVIRVIPGFFAFSILSRLLYPILFRTNPAVPRTPREEAQARND